MRRPDSFRLPEYVRMLAGILVVYVLVIGFADSSAGWTARVGLVGFLLWTSLRLHRNRRFPQIAAGLAVGAFVATGILTLTAPFRVAYGATGFFSTALLGIAIGSIVAALVEKPIIDTATVLGALCIYLLLALVFANVNQVMAAFQPHYLNGTGQPPDSSDLLYFSVITMTTVGFGDITPASLAARAVTVLEAITGQLYLVSIVAGVVGGWQRPSVNPGDGERPDG